MKHHRRSIRLPGYDYAPAGWYFVTICCKDRAHLFGEIVEAYRILQGQKIFCPYLAAMKHHRRSIRLPENYRIRIFL